MGSRFYGLNNKPEQFRQEDVQTNTVTTSTDIEVRIDDTKSWSLAGVKQALESIIRRIDTGKHDLPVV